MVVLGIPVGEYVGNGASDTGETVMGMSPAGGDEEEVAVGGATTAVGGDVDDDGMAGGAVLGATT